MGGQGPHQLIPVALQRIMGEVRPGQFLADQTRYNRTYHRHNR